MDITSLIKKYKNHDQFNDYLKDDIESAKNDLKYFYHFKRIGYHLIHIFKDEELSRSTFEHAIECCVEAEDIKDVIMDVIFLSEEWAKEL